MFCPIVTSRSLVPAFLLGEVFGVCSSFSNELFDISYSTHLVVPGSWLVTVGVALFLADSLLHRATARQLEWTWPAVVRSGKARRPAADESLD